MTQAEERAKRLIEAVFGAGHGSPEIPPPYWTPVETKYTKRWVVPVYRNRTVDYWLVIPDRLLWEEHLHPNRAAFRTKSEALAKAPLLREEDMPYPI